MAISETKGQGWRAILTQYRKFSDILTSTLFVQHPPEKGKGSRGSFKLLRQRRQQGETTFTPQDKANQSNTNTHSS